MKTFETSPRMHYATACSMIHELAKTLAVPYIKLSMDNIVIPSMKRYGFASAQVTCVRSKENPEGQIYKDGHMVVRAIDGHLIEETFEDASSSGVIDGNNTYDAYAWTEKKVSRAIEAGDTKPIGRFSPEGLANFARIYNSLKTERDRDLFCDSFMPYGIDLLLIHTDAEDKMCVEVTQELWDAGLRYWADDWRNNSMDENGMVDTTALKVGDLLVISPEGAYVCAASVARQTYRKVTE